MMRALTFLLALVLSANVWAQFNNVTQLNPRYKSIHQEQSDFYKQYNFTTETQYDALTPPVPQK